MYHLILTASSDNARCSMHLVLRDSENGSDWRTISTSGGVFPMLDGGFFDMSPEAFLAAVLEDLPALFEKSRHTAQ
jgi:hypothetical protein